jgi:hypothetical protein
MEKRSQATRTRLIWRDGKKVRAHRWIMEQILGRSLKPYEHVHHINGDPLDNRPENLTVLHVATHMRLHKQKYADKKVCVVCAAEFMVNPRKRSRNKCCSPKCASVMRARGRSKQAASSRKSRKSSGK